MIVDLWHFVMIKDLQSNYAKRHMVIPKIQDNKKEGNAFFFIAIIQEYFVDICLKVVMQL